MPDPSVQLAHLIAAPRKETAVLEGVIVVGPDSTGLVVVRTSAGTVRVPAPATGATVGAQVRLARIGGQWVLLHVAYSSGVTLPTFQPALTNPGFEAGTLAGWTQYDDPVPLTVGAPKTGGGTYSARLNTNISGGFSTAIANDPLYVIPGSYTASISYEYVNSTPLTGTFRLEAWTAPSLVGMEPDGPGLVRQVVASAVDNGWPSANLTGTFTVPASRRVLRLVFVVEAATAVNNTLMIDSLTLTAN